MCTYNSRAYLLRYARLSTKLFISSMIILIFDVLLFFINTQISKHLVSELFLQFTNKVYLTAVVIGITGFVLFVTSIIVGVVQSTASKIRCTVRKGLFAYQYGNPLHLKDGEFLPKVKCTAIDNGRYLLTIYATTVSVDDIQNVASNISSALNRKFKKYAVVIINADVALNHVQFIIEDVTADKSLKFTDVNEMKPKNPTKLIVQDNTYIDLTTSGSMLVAGKTRSGKTTGIISILLQALLCGRNRFKSVITVIDPKRAELSVLPRVVTVDEDGEARSILQALKDFEHTMTERQKHLNERSKQVGDAVHWWDMDMRPCFCFIDEYVACKSLFPKKAEKGSDYCLATFDALVKRIVTMGASAGCFIIISIAEASVDEGGLPTMLKNAMSTKILFRPTLTEGRLMWNSEKLKTFPERVYKQGDAWFSSTDGLHDDVSFVHFPHMEFAVYKELGRLLAEYYL